MKIALQFILITVSFSFFGLDVAKAQLDTVHRVPPVHSWDTKFVDSHYVYLSTPETKSFQVTIKDGGGNPLPASPVTISNNNPRRVFIGNKQVPAGTDLIVPNNSLNAPLPNSGLVLTANKEFYTNVRYKDGSSAQAASLTCKGQAAEGKTFRVANMPLCCERGFGGSISKNRNFVVSFMATKDNTTIEVSDYVPGVEFDGPITVTNDSLNVTLNAGDCYVLSGYADHKPNHKGFVGALIESDKPIVVNNGNYLGTLYDNFAQDIALDQIVPFENVGQEYAVVEADGPPKGERPMVVAHENNTKVYLNGNNTPDATLKAGEYHLINNSKYNSSGGSHKNMFIRTSKPAYVTQFLAGDDQNGRTPGMNFLAPLDCGLPNQVDLIPAIDSIGNEQFNPNGDIFAFVKSSATLSVNNTPQTNKGKSLPGKSSWKTYKLSGFTGDVSVSATGPLGVGFFGASGNAGYGGIYSGFSLELKADFAFLDTLTYSRETSGCFNDTIDVDFTGEKEPGTEFKWDFGKAERLNPSGDPSSFAQSNQGPYQLIYRSKDFDSVIFDTVKLVVKDDACTDSISKAIRIFEVDSAKPALMKNVTVGEDSVIDVQFKGIDVKDLNRYEVLRRKGSSGPFQLVDEVANPDEPDSLFTVKDTVNTRSDRLCYTIATNRGCKPTTYSDTFCATQLDGQAANNAAKLTWQRFTGYSIDSQLLLKKDGATYDTLARLGGSATTYTDQPLACNVPQSYQIKSYEQGGKRTTLSDTARVVPFDTQAPVAPAVHKLSVVGDKNARLTWTRQDSSVTQHELWLKADKQNWRIIDTVGLQNRYNFSGLDTRDSQYCARIVGIDSCSDNRSAFSTVHCAVQLEGEPDNLKNSLKWQAYQGFGNPTYEVQRLDTMGSTNQWQVINSLTNTSHIDSLNLSCGVTKRYRIRTISGNEADTSLSDTTAVTPVDTMAPPVADLRFATVTLNGNVELEWNWQPDTDQKFFEVWRNQGSGTSFSILDTVILDSTYTDQTASPRNTDHQYYIVATDSCRAKNVNSSDTDRLAVPQVQTGACRPENRLSWNRYDDLPQGVDQYEIYRNEQPTTSNPFTQLTTIHHPLTTYTDTNLTDTITYCYRIKAVDTISGYSAWTDSFCQEPFDYPEPDTSEVIRSTVTRTGTSNGAVKVTWQRYPKSDTFARGYFLYHTTGRKADNFQLIANISNLSDTTFTHQGINTSENIHNYRVVVYNLCRDEGGFFNTHQPVNLSATNQNLSIRLDWVPYRGFGVQQYRIQRSVDGGPFRPIGNVNGSDTSLVDSNVQCGVDYSYKVFADGTKPEQTSVSDTTIRTGQDTINPAKPVLEKASVSQTGTQDGQIRISWEPSASNDIKGYLLERKVSGANYQLVDTVEGITKLDQNLNTADQPYFYRIRAIDSCNNVSDYTRQHKTIHLKANGIPEAVNLNWNAYQGRAVQTYRILRGDSVLYEVSGDTTRKLDEDLKCDSTYQYQIQALLSGTDSTVVLSNTDKAEPFDNNPPDPVTLQRVSVSTFNEVVTVKWADNRGSDAETYQIYRSTAGSGGFEVVGTVAAEDARTTFQDTLPLEEKQEICYRVRARDNCGNSSRITRPDCVMKLDGEGLEDLKNQLNWPPYEEWERGVNDYIVYKQRNDSLYTPIGRLDSSRRTFTDEDLSNTADQFCYYIRAEGFGEETFSRSTRICLEQAAVVYIPNSFSPGVTPQLNDRFGPEGLYIANYEMQIYNRWGEKVFSTSEGEKWDGTYKGELVPAGMYHYQVVVRSEDGSQQTFSGAVTVVR